MSSSSSAFHTAHAKTYERMGSKATVNIAKVFLSELPEITDSSYILDNAYGPGVLTEMIKAKHPNAHIMCTDLAPGMIDIVKHKIETIPWKRVETDILDVCDLKTLSDNTFTHVLTNFGIHAAKDVTGPQKAAKEMLRVLKPGGVCVVTTWSERNFDKAFSNAARVVKPQETPFSWELHPDGERGWWLMKLLEEAGFGSKVSVKSVNGRIEASTLDELVSNMMLFKDMFCKGYNDEEILQMEKQLKEEILKLPAFEQTDEAATVKMVAWVGFAWK